MSSSLLHGLHAHLNGWHNDLPADWRTFLGNVNLDWNAVDPAATLQPQELPIFPLRRNHSDARAPKGSHVLRAFDNLPPDSVRAVLLGQDPYPSPRLARATGRSFEPGDQKTWSADTPLSLKRIVQVLARHRKPASPHPALDDNAWAAWVAALSTGWVEGPPQLFERWRAEGVLCLNLGLTLSRFDKRENPILPKVQPLHMALWTPLVTTVLRKLAERTGKPPLLVMPWSGKAKDAIEAAHIPEASLLVLGGPHPNAPGTPSGPPPFYTAPNPFTAANALLAKGGHPTISW